LGIDTPESTGQIEPWGKPASIYTKSKLQNAKEIVLESDEVGTPVFDSTGERYLAWVWYRNEGSTVWRIYTLKSSKMDWQWVKIRPRIVMEPLLKLLLPMREPTI
jgi:hypothetical protein